jgi:branched-chain amino acid aminotransferase
VPIAEVDKIWMDGELVDWADAKIHVLSHALHYGSGVFEGIRAYETARGPAVWHLEEHLQRPRT